MDKRAKKEEKILKDFQKISKEMAPKPQYFKYNVKVWYG